MWRVERVVQLEGGDFDWLGGIADIERYQARDRADSLDPVLSNEHRNGAHVHRPILPAGKGPYQVDLRLRSGNVGDAVEPTLERIHVHRAVREQPWLRRINVLVA